MTFHLPLWLRLTVALCAMLLCTQCGDPEREAKLQWREEEINAKEADIIKRETLLAKEKQLLEGRRLDLTSREQAVEILKKLLTAEVEKQKRLNREFEIKKLRGPIPQISADRVIVIDAATNDVLFDKNPDKRGAVASTTKLLTALLIVEAGKLDEIVTVAPEDSQCAPVRIGLKKGEMFSRRQLLTAMLVKSSNDIAQALARDHSGSVEAFAERMNARCKELGLENSHFRNPHGLPSKDENEPYSTARDMSLIAKACDQHPEIREMVKLKSYTFKWPSGKVTELANTNRVLRNFSDCDGMKTGYTDAAGYCLVASGERQGRRRIVVVLNDTESGVWKDAQALLEWALRA